MHISKPIANLFVHFVDPFIHLYHFLSQRFLIIPQIVSIFFEAIIKSFIIFDRLVNCLFKFVKIIDKNYFDILKISFDLTVSFFIFSYNFLI